MKIGIEGEPGQESLVYDPKDIPAILRAVKWHVPLVEALRLLSTGSQDADTRELARRIVDQLESES